MALCEVLNNTSLRYQAQSELPAIHIHIPPPNKLTREEKLLLISSILSGIGSRAHFCPETLRSRIEQCISLAEEIL